MKKYLIFGVVADGAANRKVCCGSAVHCINQLVMYYHFGTVKVMQLVGSGFSYMRLPQTTARDLQKICSFDRTFTLILLSKP